jgi:protein involved in sex pheromone biosynthesis
MEAINKKNQKDVNKAVKFLIAYNTANDKRNAAEDNDNAKEFKKFDKICETKFDNYLEVCGDLPKREVKQIENSNLY